MVVNAAVGIVLSVCLTSEDHKNASILFSRTYKWDDKDVAMIVNIEEVDSEMICTLKDGNGPLPTKWKLADLRAFDGTMEFHVRCMDVCRGVGY